MDELESVLERQVRELAGSVLGHPEGSALDRSAEADVIEASRLTAAMKPLQPL
jgi:hypothetical protein